MGQMVMMMVVHGANGESSYIHGVRSNPLCGMSFLLICLKFVIYDDHNIFKLQAGCLFQQVRARDGFHHQLPMRFVFIIIIIIVLVFIVDVNIHHLSRSSPITGGRETSDSDTSSSRLLQTPPSDLSASNLWLFKIGN